MTHILIGSVSINTLFLTIYVTRFAWWELFWIFHNLDATVPNHLNLFQLKLFSQLEFSTIRGSQDTPSERMNHPHWIDRKNIPADYDVDVTVLRERKKIFLVSDGNFPREIRITIKSQNGVANFFTMIFIFRTIQIPLNCTLQSTVLHFFRDKS